MNSTLNAAVKSYRDGSLAPLRSCSSKKMVDLILKIFTDIAKEIDDSGKSITTCHGLKSYSGAEENTKIFLEALFRRLNKPLNALEVIDVLEKWGVMAKHENIVIWKEQLEFRRRFGEDVKKAAAALVQTALRGPLNTIGRINFTNAISFAIDKSSTRDVDDSISCDLTTNTVFVHIAAPAEYVSNDRYHTLMKEASRRLLSIYSCRERLPMFPDRVASNLFSLICGSQDVRYTTTFKFHVAQDGAISPESMHVYASVISRPVCLSYRNVSAILKNPDHFHHKAIKLLQKLAGLRRQWRYSKGGALQYTGNQKQIQYPTAHLIVDEMMISANAVAAKIARSKGIPVLYRGVTGGNQYAPSSSRCSTFQGTKYTCSMYVSGTKQRDMEKGANVKLDIRPLRHASLGLDEYVQATSPIRKFSDLIFHCQLNAIVRNLPPPFSENDLLELKDKVIKLEQAGVRIERRAKKYWAYQQLMKDGAKVHRGVLRSIAKDQSERGSRPSRSQLLKMVTRRREQQTLWVVFLKDVQCEIIASAPSWGSKGMEVAVEIDEVNSRTSYVVARVTSQNGIR